MSESTNSTSCLESRDSDKKAGLDIAYDVNLTILRVYLDHREDPIPNEFCCRLLMSKLLNSGA